MTVGPPPQRITLKVVDLRKPLMSISNFACAVDECHLNNRGGFLLGAYMGEKIPIQSRGSLYAMMAWAKEDKTKGLARPE